MLKTPFEVGFREHSQHKRGDIKLQTKLPLPVWESSLPAGGVMQIVQGFSGAAVRAAPRSYGVVLLAILSFLTPINRLKSVQGCLVLRYPRAGSERLNVMMADGLVLGLSPRMTKEQ